MRTAGSFLPCLLGCSPDKKTHCFRAHLCQELAAGALVHSARSGGDHLGPSRERDRGGALGAMPALLRGLYVDGMAGTQIDG